MSNVTALKQEPISSQLEKIRHKVESTSDKWAVQAVALLIAATGDKAFELGGYLNRVSEQNLWPQEMSFVKWMDQQGILKSRGYALIKTYNGIVSCDLPFDILERIGWSKLVMIVPLLKSGSGKADEHNAKWIKTAEDSTQLELRKAVGEAKGKTTTAKPVTVKKLRSIMQKFQPEDVLKMFAEIWPDIDLKVSI